jgi:hypothetical protein
VIDELLERNRRFAETAGGVDLPAPPGIHHSVRSFVQDVRTGLLREVAA